MFLTEWRIVWRHCWTSVSASATLRWWTSSRWAASTTALSGVRTSCESALISRVLCLDASSASSLLAFEVGLQSLLIADIDRDHHRAGDFAGVVAQRRGVGGDGPAGLRALPEKLLLGNDLALQRAGARQFSGSQGLPSAWKI